MPELKYSEGAALPSNAPEWAVAASQRIKELRERGNGGLYAENDSPPDGITKILLHSCCAPCSGAMVEEMLSYTERHGLEVVVFFYNPNIHPKREYIIRKDENKKFAKTLGIEFVDCDYDADNWYERMKGLEFDPERGHRCSECFDMRMERTALYAHEHGFDAIATTNATSRWKDAVQVDGSGVKAAARYDGIQYWCRDWQTDIMTLRKYQISATQKFYKQEYCGCSYSLRDSNDWRKANGIPNIQIGGEHAGLGNRYFSNPIEDAQEESQDVVDEFFAQAGDIAAAGSDRTERRKALTVYKDRRKNEKDAGVNLGLNNW